MLTLREAAQKLGLVRKHQGRLQLTNAGQRLRDDPVAMWWHITDRLPPRKPGSSEYAAGVVNLVLMAAPAGLDTTAVLEHLGCYEPGRGAPRRDRPSVVGRLVARSVLRAR